MSDETPRLHLPQLVSQQEMTNVTWNEALAQLDALTGLMLLGQFVNDPPSNPQDGDAYLIGSAPTGAWAGYANKIATCLDGAWRFYTPFNGLRAYLSANDTVLGYRDGVWKVIGSADVATRSGSETLTNKTLGATLLPNGKIRSDGWVGLGTSNPQGPLHICTGSGSRVVLQGSAAHYNWAFGAQFNVSNCFEITPSTTIEGYTFTTPVLVADASGHIGINTSSPNPLAALDVAGNIYPHTDNSCDLGSASYRLRTIYAGTGTINTSGAAAKTGIRALTGREIAVARALAAKVRLFQFCDAVAEKGAAAARLHAGMIFEEVVAAFAAEGLDPERYGIVCRDPASKRVAGTRMVQRPKMQAGPPRPVETFTVVDGVAILRVIEEPTMVPVMEMLPVKDSEGNAVLDEAGAPRCYARPVMETISVPWEEEVPDLDENGKRKSIVGLRYAELAQFIVAGLVARLDRLETAIGAASP